nr:MAG TPA: Terminase large subunit [Caudoviricetes sp.]
MGITKDSMSTVDMDRVSIQWISFQSFQKKRIAHGGQPVLRWNMDNIFIRTDPAGNIKADKEKSIEKIDGAVATIMALDRAIRCGNDTGESVYDSRVLLVF